MKRERKGKEGKRETNLAQELLRPVGLSEDEILRDINLDSSVGSDSESLSTVEGRRSGGVEETGRHWEGGWRVESTF